jgi:hypothetical protein
MDCKLLTAAALTAALTLSPAPAAAEHTEHHGHGIGIGIPDAKSSHYVGSPVSPNLGGCNSRRGGGAGHRDGNFGCDGGDGWAYADGSWALYNNRSWEPNSYNDWWHDRPDRAYPRWVTEQRMRGTCDPDRMWWSGSGWHC